MDYITEKANLPFIPDGFVKSPDASLRFILRHCGVRESTPHSSGFARLACGAFCEAVIPDWPQNRGGGTDDLDYRGKNINDYGLKCCIFAESDDLCGIAGRNKGTWFKKPFTIALTIINEPLEKSGGFFCRGKVGDRVGH